MSSLSTVPAGHSYCRGISPLRCAASRVVTERWSFLSAIDTIDGTQWAQHQNVDELMCLGLAIGRVKFLLPREMWNGMPYFSIDVTPLKEMRKKKLDQLNERQEGNKI